MHHLRKKRKKPNILQNWKKQEKEFLLKHLNHTPLGESTICKKHFIEARRHHSTPNFIPKWKDTPRSGVKAKPVCSNQKCINPKCTQPTSDKLIKPSFESTDMLEITLGVKSSNDMPFLLCQKCYNDVYQIFHPQTPCTSCGAIPKEGSHWCRHSPHANLVSQHIEDTTGTELHIYVV